MSRGASGEAAGRLVKETVGVTAGIVTIEVAHNYQEEHICSFAFKGGALCTHSGCNER